MSQLTIYLNTETERAITQAAKRASLSLSRWSREQLLLAAGAPMWPRGYPKLLGSIADKTFKAPSELKESKDQLPSFE